jgi:hypothetical protein
MTRRSSVAFGLALLVLGDGLLVFSVALLPGCAPQPRSASYFQAHASEAAGVLRACAAGATRGAECLNAQAGVAATARDARMATYRKSF